MAAMDRSVRVAIRSPTDVEQVRRGARDLAQSLGFDRPMAERVTLATVELATNLLRYARDGELRLTVIPGTDGRGVQLESQDAGPGIADVPQALTDGFSTGGGLGSGLPAVRRLMETFSIESSPRGTRIVTCLWPTSR